MQIDQTPEELTRVTKLMPDGLRNIYFYTEPGVEQLFNPEDSAEPAGQVTSTQPEDQPNV